MLTEQEEQGEREYWERVAWEEKNRKEYFRVEEKNGVEYHYAGSHLMGKYDSKTGKSVK